MAWFLSQATSLCRDVSAAAESSAFLQLHRARVHRTSEVQIDCKSELPSSELPEDLTSHRLRRREPKQ